MRIPLTLCALVLAGLVAAPAARALEDAKPPSGEARVTVPVVLVLPGGQRLEGTLLEGSKDGSLKVKTSYAEQTFERKDWVQVSARQRPTEFTIAEQLLQSKRYKAAAGKYQAIYDTYEHLYIFGADALDGKGQALMGLDSYKKALEAYEQLFREYSGADLSYLRRYRYAVCLAEVGGKERLEDAVAQLDAVVALTDNVLTVRALDRIGRIHYGQKKYYLALRSFMQIYILYRNYAGEGAQEVAALVTRSRRNAITCCDKLLKSSDTAVKRQVERIKAGLERE